LQLTETKGELPEDDVTQKEKRSLSKVYSKRSQSGQALGRARSRLEDVRFHPEYDHDGDDEHDDENDDDDGDSLHIGQVESSSDEDEDATRIVLERAGLADLCEGSPVTCTTLPTRSPSSAQRRELFGLSPGLLDRGVTTPVPSPVNPATPTPGTAFRPTEVARKLRSEAGLDTAGLSSGLDLPTAAHGGGSNSGSSSRKSGLLRKDRYDGAIVIKPQQKTRFDVSSDAIAKPNRFPLPRYEMSPFSMTCYSTSESSLSTDGDDDDMELRDLAVSSPVSFRNIKRKVKNPAVRRCGYEIKGPSCLRSQELSHVVNRSRSGALRL
jgi:hypothetical protein